MNRAVCANVRHTVYSMYRAIFTGGGGVCFQIPPDLGTHTIGGEFVVCNILKMK